MNVIKRGEKYRCNICGNIVVVEQVGGGELFCCGEPMEAIDEGVGIDEESIEDFENSEEL